MTKNTFIKKGFGTAPVFLTAISTILGAVMFLRFGYAVGNVGFWGAIAIIVIGHMITIPTAMAIAEIATNQKVEGGGEYFIISRSFGINVGASIGLALYLSQAISVAFYIIAFGEAFNPLLDFFRESYGFDIYDNRLVTLPATGLLILLMLTKGADLGMKALYVVVAVLFLSLILFFTGGTTENYTSSTSGFTDTIANGDSFFYVFAICFPAFTGMTAGVGLSGDLAEPSKSIPKGTLYATIIGMFIYVLIAYKLTVSANPGELDSDQLIMSKIALWGPIIPIGLACATVSSALGSIMVAPRTLQAIGSDNIFPSRKLNYFLSKNKKGTKEPINATLITSVIAIIFVSIGDVDFVAEIISMFFMVTYGALCLISFLQHFAADPSYRPTFKSRWYISLIGAVLCVWLMFKMNPFYAILSILLMVVLYIGITYTQHKKQGLVVIFQGVLFQFTRQLQVFIQKSEKNEETWRPSILCISKNTLNNFSAFELLRWWSHKFGFGTYIHFVNGYFSNETKQQAVEITSQLVKNAQNTRSKVFLDTIISPSYTSSIAQLIQLPSVTGKDYNMVLFEYSPNKKDELDSIIENVPLVRSADFDVAILRTSEKYFGFKNQVHVWITTQDDLNSSLMILLAYILCGHKEWKNAEIKIFALFSEENIENQKIKLNEFILEGRLPISLHNIEYLSYQESGAKKKIINEKSSTADLTFIGFSFEAMKKMQNELFEGYDELGTVLFVNAHKDILQKND